MRTFKGDKRNMLKANANYASRHKGRRKDVERVFGVLQKRFHVLFHPAKGWSKKMNGIVVIACLVLHNMIVEDEFDDGIAEENDYERKRNRVDTACSRVTAPILDDIENNAAGDSLAFAARFQDIKDEDSHNHLQQALIKHLWDIHANE